MLALVLARLAIGHLKAVFFVDHLAMSLLVALFLGLCNAYFSEFWLALLLALLNALAVLLAALFAGRSAVLHAVAKSGGGEAIIATRFSMIKQKGSMDTSSSQSTSSLLQM